MKFQKWALFLILAVIVFPYCVSAASFTDDMAVLQNTAETQYSGLKPYSNATYGLSDQTLFTISDISSPQGHAIYRVNSAESVTVGIYTAYGTCVSRGEAGFVLGLGTNQAAWSQSKDAVYSDFGGSFWRVELDFDNRYDPMFSPASALPTDAIGYGINIYALPKADKPLSASVTRSVSETLCYEEYTVAIPAGTQYVKVEINDVTAYPLKGGGTMPNRIYTALASVRISGEALVMGEPAKVERKQAVQAAAPAADDEEEESEAYSAAFSVSAVLDLPEEPEAEYEPEASSSKSASSKFEGTITSSSKQEKSQASQAVVQSESSASSSKRAESTSLWDDDPREAVYEIRRENTDSGMSSGVTVYIVIVSGALLLLLVLGRKK